MQDELLIPCHGQQVNNEEILFHVLLFSYSQLLLPWWTSRPLVIKAQLLFRELMSDPPLKSVYIHTRSLSLYGNHIYLIIISIFHQFTTL